LTSKGPPRRRAFANAGALGLRGENYSGSLALGSAGDRAMGKFFLIIIALSVAVLLAMSAYVISL
jgi:hypothetical protein